MILAPFEKLQPSGSSIGLQLGCNCHWGRYCCIQMLPSWNPPVQETREVGGGKGGVRVEPCLESGLRPRGKTAQPFVNFQGFRCRNVQFRIISTYRNISKVQIQTLGYGREGNASRSPWKNNQCLQGGPNQYLTQRKKMAKKLAPLF